MPAKRHILYFIAGSQPSAEDKAAAAELGAASFRSARFVDEFAEPEHCDAVAGAVPESYKIFPLAAAVGNEDAPVETPVPAGPVEPVVVAVAAENVLAAASGDEDLMKGPAPAQQPWAIASAPINEE